METRKFKDLTIRDAFMFALILVIPEKDGPEKLTDKLIRKIKRKKDIHIY